MTKDGVLGLPANLVQPGDVLALTGSLSGESFDGFFASLLKTSRFFATQAHWLSFGGLLVNLSNIHHESVTFSLRSLVRSGPGVQGSVGV